MIITLLTDFGLQDSYAAGMKGIILGICPDARLIDISHLVPARDIRSGAFLLESVYADFPPGTIHVAVVDPGVGTGRRAIAIKTPHYFFLGPDNGIFSWIPARECSWESRSLENSEYWRPRVSRTFHGRDIFAPVAAHLARGIPFPSLGSICSPHIAEWSRVLFREFEIEGEVVHVDHFGNAITNITRDHMSRLPRNGQKIVTAGGHCIRHHVESYGHTSPGTAITLIGSSGRLEIAVNMGNASTELGIAPGTRVIVSCSSSS